MKRKNRIWIVFVMMFILSSCGVESEPETIKDRFIKVGIIKSKQIQKNKEINKFLNENKAVGGFDYKFFDLSNKTDQEEIAKGAYDIIIFIDKGDKGSATKLKDELPEQKFAVVDDVILGDNVASYVFNENEGAFLLGRIAGAMTNGKIGFIGGKNIKMITNQADGFWNGIQSVKKETVSGKNESKFLSDFRNMNGAYDAAKEITKGESGMLFSRCYEASLGVYTYVSESNERGKKIFIVGDEITNEEYKGKFKGIFIGDFKKDFKVIIRKIIEDVKNGEKIEGDIFEFGIFEKGIYIEDEVRSSLPTSVVDSLDEVIEKIKNGEIVLENSFE